MKIFNRNATAGLIDKVATLSERHNSWRCIYIHLSDKKEQYSKTMRQHFIANAITELLAEVDGYIYFCQDEDVFILFQGALKPIVGKLGSHFEDIRLAQLPGQAQDSPFTIFDLSLPQDWWVFFSLCKAKYSQISNPFQQADVGNFVGTTL